MEVLPEYCLSYIEKDSISGYVDLPTKILEDLKDARFPLIFKLTTIISKDIRNSLFCGVKEFIEGQHIRVPSWMMENLLSPNNGIIQLSYIKYIPYGKHVELEPLDEKFFEIPNYDVYLESQLSDHCILTKDQIFKVKIEGIYYRIKVNNVEVDWEKAKFDNLDINYSEELYNSINITNQDIKVSMINKFMKETNSNDEIHKINNSIDNLNEISEEVCHGNLLEGTPIPKEKLREHYIKYFSKKKG
jgi:hypothetical protein